jgi:hypothetical protein
MPDNEDLQQEEKKLEQEENKIRVELADGSERKDPVSSVQSAELKNLADTYRFHAELLDEQRGQLQGLKDYGAVLKEHLDALQMSVSEWREFLQQERDRVEQQRPPVGGKPKKPFGGPGW